MLSRRLAPGPIARAGILFATCILGACRAPHLPVGTSAPPIAAEWLRGDPVDPRTANTIVIVDLFATWCGPCLDSIDDLDALQRRYAQHGVRVVVIAVRDGRERVQAFLDEQGRDHAYAVAFDATGEVFDAWYSNALPTAYVVGPEGRVEAVTRSIGLDYEVASLLLGRTELDHRDSEVYDACRTARAGEDWAELERIADSFLQRDRGAVAALVAKVESQRDPAASAAAATEAIAALADDAFGLATMVHRLAARGRLVAVGAAAHAALQRVRCAVPSLYVRVARVLAAHAAGASALATTGAELLAELREQPIELLALASITNLGLPWLRSEPPLAVQPDPQPLHEVRVRWLEAAAQQVPTAYADEALLHALIDARADEPRTTAVGRRVVARQARDADALNSTAWALLQDGAPEPAALPTIEAAIAALRAIPGWETAPRLDTVALSRFVAGDLDGAIFLQERAIAWLPSPRADYAQRLERYRNARAERAQR